MTGLHTFNPNGADRPTPASIGVLGAGTWGMALARMLTNLGHEVMVWSALPEEIERLSATRRQPNLPDMVIPDATGFTTAIETACRGRDVVLFAVPSVYVRATARAAAPCIRDGQIIVDVAKGMEPDTLLTMTQVIRSELDAHGAHHNPLVALSGPTHAEEVARDLPTTIVSACPDVEAARRVQDIFMNSCLRVYTNTDIEGVELCGAVKNIIALAAGISTGLGYGDNARAALITRGMAEITRLGTAMGCSERTFPGLAGMGDLIVTATSRHSRNNRCGQLIGEGVPPREAIARIGMVVEGINALDATMQLARRYNVEMPITEAVDQIVNHGMRPRDVVYALMTREKSSENPAGQ
ncbi:MAG: NAD(P)-dependent glycerol-3-phosphate dehydrogenase [Clostridia bacterium]|nr:NAD(P)-dependent glycerol-3-phosphate dehydrogenase [Clostridia bacterium]MBR3273022.1 NAD(P)-dependent glycerol-3-phosphate dehydrogenase [Clostridia bacterium]